jgi:choline kinase
MILGQYKMTKAVLLAAGRGTRLLPLTEAIPKSLLRLKGKPIIEYILDRAVEVGADGIVIVIGHFGDKLKEHVGDNYKGVPVEYIFNPIYDKTNSTYSLWLARDVAGEDFVVINADTICSRNVLKYIFDANHEIALAVDDSLKGALPEEAMKVTIIDGRIRDASKKIPPEKTHGDAIGIYKFKGKGVEELYNELQRVVDENILDQLFTFAVKRLMDRFDVYPVSTEGLAWIEIDDHKDFKDAEEVVARMSEEDK